MPIQKNKKNRLNTVSITGNTEIQQKNNTIPNVTEIDGLCKMLNIGKNTAYNLLTSGEIDSFKVGSVWKIPVSSINEYIERKCIESKLVLMYDVIKKNRDMYYDKYKQIPWK